LSAGKRLPGRFAPPEWLVSSLAPPGQTWLAGGMKKRVAIARALVVEPQLIFYDESTSELDPVSSVEIAEDRALINPASVGNGKR
jgi:ABC-type lipopolysaccharide export system ATPase subunit